MSRPYRWDVLVEAEDIDFDALEVDLLARPAWLDYTGPLEAERQVHGVVAALTRIDGSLDGHRRRLRLRLVPRLALLSRNRMSRIFQDLSVPEIVCEVLAEHGVAVSLRLLQRYRARDYCVQYQESDLGFVSRLLAEEGIFYFFLQPPDALVDAARAGVSRLRAGGGGAVPPTGEVMVLADHPGACPAIAPGQGEASVGVGPLRRAPALVCHAGESDIADEFHVGHFARERAVRPQATLLRDYDFRHPGLALSASQSAHDLGGLVDDDARLDDLDDVLAHRLPRVGLKVPGVPALAIDPRRATVYAHHGEDNDPEVTRAAAQARFEQERRGVFRATGSGWCRRLRAGHRFGLEGHADDTLCGEYVATEVRHLGRTRQAVRDGVVRPSYESSFVCIPAGLAYRPSARLRSPRQVLETARVVGPPGEEIYTDAHGRIKVQFHWDLLGRGDERSSCWLRVSQAWAGAHWGAQFVPRVGMEVVVSFLGGDLDRPLVLGCLYNGENTAPFALPGDRTRSGFRTQSSPGGTGYNELSFEDAAGHEQVYLHAQRNLDEVVRNDHNVQVGRDEATTVSRHQTLSVLGNQKEEVQGERTFHVKREHRETHDAAHHITTRGPEHRWNLDRVEHRIEGRARYVHTTAVDEDFEDERTVRAKGCVTTLVGAVDEERHWGLHVEGTSEQYASKGHEVRSPESIVLRSGWSTLAVTPAGIDLCADTVSIRVGNTLLTLDAKAITARAEETITLEGQKEARLLAPVLSLTKADALPEAERPKPPTRILLTDTHGTPLAGKRYRVKQADGTVRTGFLDREGAATLPGEQGGTVEFPEFDEVRS